MRAACLALVAATSAAVAQGTVTYYWDVNGTGSNTVAIGPGDTVNLKMWGVWEPDDYGFAGSIYDILGLENWDSGTITDYENQLDQLTDDGDLQPNNDILGIESFALPPLFHQPWYPPPVFLYEIEWAPHDYTPRTVRVGDANHFNNDLYTDQFGSSVGYDAAPGEAIIHIVPAPAAWAPLALPLLPRRRRA